MNTNEILQQLLLGGYGGEYSISMDDTEANELLKLIDGELFQKMEALNRLCSFYSMCQNPITARITQFGPKLLNLFNTEEDIDLLILICRCLTNIIDSIPEAGFPLITHGLVDTICEKLSKLEYIDLSEQCIRCVELLVIDFPRDIYSSKFLVSSIPFIEFHPLTIQRKILRIASICSKKYDHSHLSEAKTLIPYFVSLMLNQDKQVVEYACVTVSHILEGLRSSCEELDSISNLNSISISNINSTNTNQNGNGYIDEITNTIVNLLSSSNFITSYSKQTVSQLFYAITRTIKKSNKFFESFIRQKSLPELLCSICDSNQDYIVDCTKVIAYLLPECKNTFICFASLKKHSILKIEKLKKIKKELGYKNEFFMKNLDLFHSFSEVVLPQLVKNFEKIPDVFDKMYSLQGLSSIVQFEGSNISKLFQDISISTFLADLLSSNNLALSTTAIQIATQLLDKLPNIFPQYYLREGVISEVEKILGQSSKDIQSKTSSIQISKDLHFEKTPTKKTLKTQKSTPKQKLLGLLSMKKKSSLSLNEKSTTNSPSKSSFPQGSRLNSDGLLFEELKDYCYSLAEELLKKYYFKEKNIQSSEMDVELKKIGNLFSSSETIIEALKKLKNILHLGVNGEKVTNFEFINSGLIQILLNFFQTASFEQICEFINIFHSNVSFSNYHSFMSGSPSKSVLETTHLRELVRKLQECLSSEEKFSVYNDKFERSPFRALQILGEDIILSIERSRKTKGSVNFNVQIPPIAPVSIVLKELENQIKIKTSKKKKTKKSDKLSKQSKSPRQINDNQLNITHIMDDLMEEEEETEILNLGEVVNSNQNNSIFNNEIEEEEKQKYELYFEGNGQNLKEDSLIFKEIYFSTIRKKHPSKSNLLNKQHLLKYRRCKFEKSKDVSIYNRSHLLNSIIVQIHQTAFIAKLFVDQSSVVSSILAILKIIYILNVNGLSFEMGSNNLIPQQEFVNVKLSSKVQNLCQDPFIILTETLPDWVLKICIHCKFLFNLTLRKELFELSSLGVAKKLSILQLKSRSNDDSRFIYSHQKIRVSRQKILEQAYHYFMINKKNRGKLEVEFEDEVGTGNGPTNEFFSLVSTELKKNSLGIWKNSNLSDEFVHSSNGLFPRFIDPNGNEVVCFRNIFKFIGRYLARALIDDRLTDISFSNTLVKAIMGEELSFHDISEIDPEVYNILVKLQKISTEKESIEKEQNLSPTEKQIQIDSLTLDGARISDLGINFTLIGTNIELIQGGSELDLTIWNLDQFIEYTIKWMLNYGIQTQVNAIKEGFSYYSKISNLNLFSSLELDAIFSGEDSPWTKDELINSIQCDHGYTMGSDTVEMLVQVLSDLNKEERKLFIKFVTGSTRLPVGGIAALNPKLTVVKKDVEGNEPNSYLPSCMTCSHYLKLPNYTTIEILKSKLHQAMSEGQSAFHLS